MQRLPRCVLACAHVYMFVLFLIGVCFARYCPLTAMHAFCSSKSPARTHTYTHTCTQARTKITPFSPVQALSGVSVALLLDVSDPSEAAQLEPLLSGVGTVLPLGVSSGWAGRAVRLGGRAWHDPAALGPVARALEAVQRLVGWGPAREDARVVGVVQELYRRHTSDDLLYTLLVLVRQFRFQVERRSNRSWREAWLRSCLWRHPLMHICRSIATFSQSLQSQTQPNAKTPGWKSCSA
jgi:hypothetical protein